MKKAIIYTILGFMLGSAITVSAAKTKFVQIPEYIGGYKTLDLLQYVADQKSGKIQQQPQTIEKTVYVTQPLPKTSEQLSAQYEVQHPFTFTKYIDICTSDVPVFQSNQVCVDQRNDYSRQKANWVTQQLANQ